MRDIGVRGSSWAAPGQLHNPIGVALDGDGSVYVAHTVSVFNQHGTFVRSIGQGHLHLPAGVAVCPSGRVYVTSYSSSQDISRKVFVFDKTGSYIKSILSRYPHYLAVDGKGQVCVTEGSQKRILIVRDNL